jgi:hypothetical protein
MKRLQTVATAVGLIAVVACGEKIAGPKPPSPLNDFIKATTTLSKTVVGRGDTMRFHFSVENITADSLTLSTDIGCQIMPFLDQVAGARQRPTLQEQIQCPDSGTTRKLAAGEVLAFSVLLRGYDPSKDIMLQTPGFVLKAGIFDASVLVRANEIGGEVNSDWVRFEVK